MVTALIAQGGVEDRLRGHVRWAIDHGVTREELEALGALLAVYVGYPRASVGLEIIREELARALGLPARAGPPDLAAVVEDRLPFEALRALNLAEEHRVRAACRRLADRALDVRERVSAAAARRTAPESNSTPSNLSSRSVANVRARSPCPTPRMLTAN